MRYTPEQYEQDLNDPSTPHLSSRERFKAFYEQLALGPAKQVQYTPHRTDFIQPTPGGLLIELGCHVGYNLIVWTQRDPQLRAWGVDVSENMLAEARRRISRLPASQQARIELFRSFIEDFVPNATPTDVVLTETLEHVQDPLPVLTAAVNLHANNLWITVPNHRWGNYSHVRGIDSGELRSLLDQAGFKGEATIWEENGITFSRAVENPSGPDLPT